MLVIVANDDLIEYMRAKVPGFDPYYNGWQAFETGGAAAVEAIEAPLLLYAADQDDPELVEELVNIYQADDLRPADLRFGAWPDISPVQARSKNEPIGVHINTFGGRQRRYGLASGPEKQALDALTSGVEELVRQALAPAHGVGVFQFGKIPTLHRHVVARERELDGLNNWKERNQVQISLEERREMRRRLTSHPETAERLEAIYQSIGAALRLWA